MEEEQAEQHPPPLSPYLVARAIKFTYIQAVLTNIYIALTGGMFIVGFALELGANNVQVGLLTSLPMVCVVMQIVGSVLVERGVSRRGLVTWGSVAAALGWALIAAIPFTLSHSRSDIKVAVLLTLVTVISMLGNMIGNARSSWIADLVPPKMLGEFFGKSIRYGGVVATLFSIAGGSFLDHAKRGGIGAFAWLFIFACMIGLVNAVLHIPQVDVPIKAKSSHKEFAGMIRATLHNRPLMIVTLYALVWSMQLIAGPFIPTYLLRDVKISYVSLGAVTAVATLAMLISSPFWGRMVDRHGCRPVIIACSAMMAPVPLGWIFITSPAGVFRVLVPMNVVAGLAAGGVGVALNTLLFNVIPPKGRSVQIAVYATVVLLLTSPMPTIGGYLPDWLKAIGINADLRCTFWAAQCFLIASVFIARLIKEPSSRRTVDMIRDMPNHLRLTRKR